MKHSALNAQNNSYFVDCRNVNVIKTIIIIIIIAILILITTITITTIIIIIVAIVTDGSHEKKLWKLLKNEEIITRLRTTFLFLLFYIRTQMSEKWTTFGPSHWVWTTLTQILQWVNINISFNIQRWTPHPHSYSSEIW